MNQDVTVIPWFSGRDIFPMLTPFAYPTMRIHSAYITFRRIGVVMMLGTALITLSCKEGHKDEQPCPPGTKPPRASILDRNGLVLAESVMTPTGVMRRHPQDRLLGKVLGNVDSIGIGDTGLEDYMDLDLRDHPDRQVRLSIDSGLQRIMEEAVEKFLQTNHPQRVIVILADPGTGEILSMASSGERESTAIDRHTFDGVCFRYEPGSTFKPVTCAAYLECVPRALNSTVFCHEGSYDKDDILIKDVTPYGNLSPREVLAHSSNIGTAKMAMAVGSPRFWNVITDFGFGRRTGVELPYESSGGIPLPEYADKKVLPGMGFGRMILVTPIEMLKFYCALANGGTEVRPTLLADHKVDRVERRCFSPETALILRDALKESAKEAEVGKTPDGKVTLAGKTGTGLGFDKNGNFSKKRYVTSFAGYFPADHPKIAAIVVVDDASVTEEKNTGTSLAAPFFAEIAQMTSGYLRLREQ